MVAEVRWENSKIDRYQGFVEHPRFGRMPRFTGLNPGIGDPGVSLHWSATLGEEAELLAWGASAASGSVVLGGASGVRVPFSGRIPYTAIRADSERQTAATVPVTHYFDLEKQCRDCHQWFIFFAEEQRHWYEELGFGLDSLCVRCPDCRKKGQELARLRFRYVLLLKAGSRTEEESLELATVCLALVDAGVFSARRREFVRMLLKRICPESAARQTAEFARLVARSKPQE